MYKRQGYEQAQNQGSIVGGTFTANGNEYTIVEVTQDSSGNRDLSISVTSPILSATVRPNLSGIEFRIGSTTLTPPTFSSGRVGFGGGHNYQLRFEGLPTLVPNTVGATFELHVRGQVEPIANISISGSNLIVSYVNGATDTLELPADRDTALQLLSLIHI